MIPLRVKLKGFLCYKDEQEVSFDGASLWMLSGLNGSGKSAIFDGVTFALFGHHRGGSQKNEELINKQCDGLEVEFEFLQEHQPYRIRRAAKRKSGGGTSTTQQIYRQISVDGNGKFKWEALTDTHKKVDFDKWIRENIGLTYDTFTSSVVLLQGKAEKLLDSTAKGRFEVLAGIVDLDRFRKLHERSEDLRRSCDAAIKHWRERLAGLPEVTAMELLEAETNVQTAEKVRQEAMAVVERWQGLEYQVKQWQDKSDQLNQMRKKVIEAQALVHDAKRIEMDALRLEDLRKILPTVKAVMEQRNRIKDSDNALETLRNQLQIEEQLLSKQDDALKQAREQRTLLEKRAEEEDQRLREVSVAFHKMTTALEKLKEYERLENDLLHLQEDMKRLPAQPDKEVQTAQAELERLTSLAQTVPVLTRFEAARRELREMVELEQSSAEKLKAIEVHGKKLSAHVNALTKALHEAVETRQKADEDVTRTRTLADQAQQALDDLQQVGGSKICRHCGQALTAEHMREENKRRKKEAADSEKQFQEAKKRQQTAHDKEKQLRSEHSKAEQERQEARDDYMDIKHKAAQATTDVKRLSLDCERSFRELPDEFREQISKEEKPNWLQTVYPSRAELGSVRGQLRELEPARERLQEAQEVRDQWQKFKGREENLRQSLQRMESELPENRQTLRETHVKLETEEKSLEKSLKAVRTSLAEAHKDIDRRSLKREETQADLSTLRTKIRTEESSQVHCERELNRLIKHLPEDWRPDVEKAGFGDYQGWLTESQTLIDKGTDERFQRLQQARVTVDSWQQQCVELEAQLEQFPDEVRQGPELVQGELAKAREQFKQRDTELGQTRKIHDKLKHDYEQREEWQQEFLQADKKLAHAKLLSELLGRDRLQLHLVRQAERQVIDHANSVLDRLSGGELYLRLSGEAGGEGTSAKALELEAHNRITGEKPINVAFLSGSQKFRVAVSLALGIGQYASRQHRPIESVIIDEGFGCLDRNARQVMIQELQNLRNQMRCILLVSHQEEFADSFSDGYHFELNNGTTIATRYQR